MNFGPGKGRTVPALLLVSVLAIVGLAANVSPASAAPVLWAGHGSNDIGPANMIFSVQNGRAKLVSLQFAMACTDSENHRESDRAFYVTNGPTATLDRNRFNFDFHRSAGGRLGHIRLSGILRSNGRGSTRLDMSAIARSDRGGVIETCQASVNFAMRRGR